MIRCWLCRAAWEYTWWWRGWQQTRTPWNGEKAAPFGRIQRDEEAAKAENELNCMLLHFPKTSRFVWKFSMAEYWTSLCIRREENLESNDAIAELPRCQIGPSRCPFISNDEAVEVRREQKNMSASSTFLIFGYSSFWVSPPMSLFRLIYIFKEIADLRGYMLVILHKYTLPYCSISFTHVAPMLDWRELPISITLPKGAQKHVFRVARRSP